MKVLVCDDNADQCDTAVAALGTQAHVNGLSGAELKGELLNLFGRVAGVLKGNGKSFETSFDGFDLAIVDNNLADLELKGARLTAEAIIGYLRTFTDIPYIVSLNKNPNVDFDLRYLLGDYQSIADLALNTGHLSNARLWGASGPDDFAPWYWPRLDDAASRRENQIKFVEERLETPTWEVLGFPSEAKSYLSRHAESALWSLGGGARSATFGSFFDASRTLLPADRNRLTELMKSGNALARNAVHRVVAHEVDRWIRRDVLGVQDVLIDLPHLLCKMPFLLGERANDVAQWNEVVTAACPPYSLDEDMYEQHLAPTLFTESVWVPTPSFWWPSLRADERLTELFFEATSDWAYAVFCEDVSRFVPVPSDESDVVPQEFEAEIPGSWPRRFVLGVESYEYSPRCRIVGPATRDV